MEQAWVSWSSLLIFLLITDVLLYTKVLEETKETLGFVVIIFIRGGISIGVAPFPPGYAYGAEKVDATQTYHKRWSPSGDFLKKK